MRSSLRAIHRATQRRCHHGLARRLRHGGFALLLASALSCSPAPQQPNLLLVVIDTLRADHVGAYGYARPTTPGIDRLAAEGTLFEHAFSTSSWTKPAVGSLFTSRLPSEHRAVAFQQHLRLDLPTLAESLGAAGYLTMGVSGNFVHVAKHTGMARGFEVWLRLSKRTDDPSDTLWTQQGRNHREIKLRAPHAPEVNRAVLSLLPEPDGRPLFLYVHYMDPHTSYVPPEHQRARFARDPAAHAAGPPASSDYVTDLARGVVSADAAERRRLVDLYDAEIAAADASLTELVAALGARGYGDPLLVTVVADHGEEFGEHGSWFHGIQLHAESVAVPLVIWDSRGRGVAQRRAEPVDLLDVPTTLLAAAGAPRPDGMVGRDLRASVLEERVLVAEQESDPAMQEQALQREQRVAVTDWPWKLIRTASGGLLWYRLDRDPGERVPLPSGDPVLAEWAERNLAERPMPASDVAPLDPEQSEALRALGYLD